MNILVTGATDGIGRQTALELGRLGHSVLVHGRSAAKADATATALRQEAPQARFTPVHADLGRLDDVRRLGSELGDAKLDVLLHNAGVFQKTREVTVDGFEVTFAVNHLAPFLLTHLLLPSLPKSGRVVLVSSVAHQRGKIDFEDLQSTRHFDGYGTYAASKLANVLFCGELARRLGPAPSVFALHPGVIGTKLLTSGFGVGGASLEEGARTSVYAATDPSLAGTTDRYFSDGRPAKPSAASQDPATQRRLYEKSAELVGISPL